MAALLYRKSGARLLRERPGLEASPFDVTYLNGTAREPACGPQSLGEHSVLRHAFQKTITRGGDVVEDRVACADRIARFEGADDHLVLGDHGFVHLRQVAAEGVTNRPDDPRPALEDLLALRVLGDRVESFVKDR